METKRQVVTTPSLLAVDGSFNDERFMKVRIDVLESDVEARGHGFKVTRECLEKSMDSFSNIPILADVITTTDEDGNQTLDYGSHDFHIENDKFNDGEGKIIYEEAVVGIVPESCDAEVRKNDRDHYVLSVTGFLYREYGNYCCDVLESRNGQTAVSAEIDISDISHDANEGIDIVGLVFAHGITLLGENVGPAIPGAKAVILSSKKEGRQKQLLSVMQELKESLDKYMDAAASAQNEGKEEIQSMKFEELLARYNLKAEDITFDYTNMSDDELESAFEKLAKPIQQDAAVPAPESKGNTVELSVKLGETVKTLSKSLTDVIYALTDLVNVTYASDGDYYDVEVFDDGTAKSKYVIMRQWYGSQAFKQTWALNKEGNYTLKGDREEIFAEWVTADEKDKLNSMRANCASLEAELSKVKAELAKHESEPEKKAVLESDEYSQIVGTPEYTELLENHFDITKEDLSAKLDMIVLSKAKETAKETAKVNLASKKETDGVKLFPTGGGGIEGRYGGIFAT